MSSISRQLGILAMGATLLSACQTAEERASAAERLEAEIAAKQGEPVKRICFAASIDSWRALGKSSLLLKKGVNDWYKVDLRGTCDPRSAFDVIAIESRPSGALCLTPGDKITTPDVLVSGSCLIDKIYQWDEDAPVP